MLSVGDYFTPVVSISIAGIEEFHFVCVTAIKHIFLADNI